MAGALVLLVALGAGSDEAERARAYELKAAMLFKFVKYVEWPDEHLGGEQEPIVVGVIGKDPFGQRLERAFAGKRNGSHPFQLRRFANAAEISRCHLLFVPAGEAQRLPSILERIRGRSILVIGESRGFARRGGIINFYVRQGKTVRFEINPAAARRENLKISSNLLKLARIVADEDAPR